MSAMRSAAARLLAELDPLSFPERMSLLAHRARALSGPGELDAVLSDLYRGQRFHREVAVFMAVVTGHRATIVAALDDPVWAIHRPTVTAWLRSGVPSAGEVAAFVAEASWHTRRHVYRQLRRFRHLAVADELIDAVWERFGDEEAASLLTACSADVVMRVLPELGYAVGNWSLLGQVHPAAVLSAAESQLADLPVPDRARWWGRSGAGVLTAGSAYPLRVLDLLERYAPAGHLPGALDRYAVLAAASTVRVARLLAEPGRERWLATEKLPRSLLRHLASLDTADLAPVAQRLRTRESALVALLKAIPPGRRAALYDAAYAGMDRSQSRPSDQILDVLPRARRRGEARRVLELGPVRDDVALILHYTAFMPWDQAKAPLTDATRRALAEDRAVAYELLVASADRAGEPEVVSEVVTYLRRLRNEQDPVRARALAALARVRPRLLQPEAAEALEQIAADTLAARDASNQSRQALTALAVAILRQHVGTEPLMTWSLRTLEQIFGDRVPALGRIDTQLRRGQESDFFEAVRDWLEAGMRRGSYEPLFAVTQSLHRRAWRLPALQEMLHRSTGTGNVSAVMRRGITLWLADPASRPLRVEQVLRADSSAVTLPAVWAVLCHRRTDLLDRVLAGSPPRGKFLAAGVRWVPLNASGTDRWLPRQQAAYAGLLARTAADAGAKIYLRTGAIAAAARLGDAGWDVVHRYVGSPNTNLAEAALAALARAGRPGDALPVLLSHSGDDQARAAIYAVGRAARFIPPRQLEPILTAEPAAGVKVTARKEVLRLAALLSVPDAGNILRSAWTQQGQHRDVRAAIVSAARGRMHDPASWLILDEAAMGSPEEALAIVAMTDPLQCAPRHRRHYGTLVAQACRSSDQHTARKAWQALPGWAHWAPDISALVTARLTDLGDRTLWRLAVPPLIAVLGTGRSGSLLHEVTAQLAGLDHAMADSHEPGRDRPARQRLNFVTEQVTTWAHRTDLDLDRSPLADAGRRLSGVAGCTRQAAGLLAAAVHTHREQGQLLGRELAEICDLLHDHPATASQIAQAVAVRVADDKHADPDAVHTAAASLEDDGRLCAGLFAVALARYGAKLGWPAAWQALIRSLRNHHVPDVRAAALEIVMAPE